MSISFVRNITIRGKLLITSIILFVLLSVTGAALLLGYKYVTNQASTANEFNMLSMNIQIVLRGINEVIVTEGTSDSIETMDVGVKGFDEIHTKLLSEIRDANLHKRLAEKIAPEWQAIKEGIEPFYEHELDIEVEGLMLRYGRVITKAEALLEELRAISAKARTTINADSKKTIIIKNIMIAFLGISLICVSVLLFHLYRSIITPIKELNRIAEGFSCGDLSIIMDNSKKDEFGKLASYFNRATEKLSNMITQVRVDISTVVSNSEKLSDTSQQISSTAQDQSDMTAQAATAMEELNTSFVEVAQKTKNVAVSANEVNKLAVKSEDIIAATVSSMEKIAQSINDSEKDIDDLGKGSEQIGDITNTINDIAGQTNLLALNAAIEAARAGEQGRGFAVVADEVRILAEKTTLSTKEIEGMIKGLQEKTKTIIETLRLWSTEVEAGLELSNEARNSLQMILASVNNVTDQAHQISVSAEEQSKTGDEIASNLEATANLSRETAENIQSSSDSIKDLDKLTQRLQQLVSEFKLRNRNNDLVSNLSIDRQSSSEIEQINYIIT